MRKKKFLSSLLIISLMMYLLPIKIFCTEQQTTLKVTPSVAEAHPGEDVTFIFAIGPVTELACLHIRYDIPEGLTYKSYSQILDNSALGSAGSINHNENNKEIKVNSPFGYTTASETSLFSITCSVNNDATVNSNLSLTVSDPGTGDYCCSTDTNDIDLAVTLEPVTIKSASVPATEILLDQTSISLEKSRKRQLKTTLTPANATDLLNWSSDNTNVATVDNTGLVIAVNVGLATITVRAGDSGPTATCTVNVVCSHTNKVVTEEKTVTCTQIGNSKYYYCEDCGKYLKADGTTVTTVAAETIPALGHNYEGVAYSSDETQHWKICSRDGCSEESARENHCWGSVTYTWPFYNSTCIATHTCTVCGKEVTEIVSNVSAETFIKSGESLNEIYFAVLLLSAAILALYLSLKKRKEAK